MEKLFSEVARLGHLVRKRRLKIADDYFIS
uniref:Uncharacterized protein n=1 Tax=Tetranychus urticae TaxID=32264 RepID=T1JSQ6_TETUR